MKTFFKPQDIIKMNLELQTVQRELHKLGVYKPSYDVITSERFLNNFKLWDEPRREKFTKLICGGQKYYNIIKGFLNKK